MKNFNINLVEMKKKIDIENNLLTLINTNLKECFNDIQYIKKNYNMVSIIMNKNENLENTKSNFILLEQIIEKTIDYETKAKLFNKLFEYVEQIYWYFQYFFLKKKDFMGMNLTGLIQGKMETGLGFRNTLEKMPISLVETKYSELFQIIHFINLENFVKPNNMIYKINANSFKWNEYGLEMYSNLFIITDLDTEKYYFIVSK